MNKQLGVIMDPIATITRDKDTTYAMMLEAMTRGWAIHYMRPHDLFLQDGTARAHTRALTLYPEREDDWYKLDAPTTVPLGDLDVILMRQDPPFNMEYIYTTYLLEFAEKAGAWVINKPQSLRDANEKVFANYFPDLIPPSLITRNQSSVLEFIDTHGTAVLKPLNGMHGKSVFKASQDDSNLNVILETLMASGTQTIMAQRFIPDVTQGDKRIILINGEPVPYGLLRVPQGGDFRANLAAGGIGQAVEINARDREICKTIGPTLRKKGLDFVGIDVIGDYVTEINVTSPTCVREIDAAFDVNISQQFFDFIEKRLTASTIIE